MEAKIQKLHRSGYKTAADIKQPEAEGLRLCR